MPTARPARACRGLLLLLPVLLLPGTAAAAPAAAAEDPEVAAARAHLGQARLHFNLGEFDAAIREFKEAYRLRPVPALLFNLGQSSRLAGELKQAKFYYERYLNEMRDPPNRAEVEEQIRQITALLADPTIAEDKAPKADKAPPAPKPEAAVAGAERPANGGTSAKPEAPAAPQTPPAPPPEAAAQATTAGPAAGALPEGAEKAPGEIEAIEAEGAPGGLGWLRWTMVGVGGLALAAGGLLELQATKAHGMAEDASWDAGGPRLGVGDAAERYQEAATLSRAALGTALGGVALVGGGIAWMVLSREGGPAVAAAPLVGPALAGVSLHGRF